MFYKWGVVISYQFLHLSIIQGYSKLSILDKGFPKGGVGGWGGSDVWERFPNNIGFFLRAYLSNLHTFVLIQIPSVTRTANTTHRRRQYCIFHQKGMRQHERLARDMSFHWTGYGTDHTSTGGSAHRRRTCREAQLLC